MNIGFCSAKLLKFPLATATSQNICNLQLKGEEFVSKLLDRRWALLDPETKIHQIAFSDARVQHEGGSLGKIVKRVCPSMGDGMVEEKNHDPSFYIVRDDLLHPLVNGNKARKLDALLPLVEDYSVTDVVTCGGCQSAHATAVAVSCAERGLRSHLLLRGEQPKTLTGYNLISKMYGNVTYVPRSEYANREEMLKRHADLVAGSDGSVVWFSDILDAAFTNQAVEAPNSVQSRTHEIAETWPRKVVIVNEGAGDAIALLGVIRLVKYLSHKHLFGRSKSLKLIVDAGTGTTAVGLGLGALCLGLPWEISAVMLADTEDGYREQEKRLISDFKKYYASDLVVDEELDGGVVNWVERSRPRKFGNVMEGEVEACQRIAQQTGVLVDPIYTLAAWELATLLGEEEASSGGARVAMLHTGGTLGMFGLAQRYKSYF